MHFTIYNRKFLYGFAHFFIFFTSCLHFKFNKLSIINRLHYQPIINYIILLAIVNQFLLLTIYIAYKLQFLYFHINLY